VRLEAGSRVAVIGAGPSGLVTAKHLLAAGFDVTVLEAADDLGGQWNTGGAVSGVWPGMCTNTSRAMTAFYDLPGEPDLPLHPAAEQIHAYLHRYADTFGVTERIRYSTTVREVRPGWYVDDEPFDAVVAASGRFRKPRLIDGLAGFSGETLHAFDYPGAEAFQGRRVLVYGNGISGHEIASDLADRTDVVSAYRKPRYVLQKRVDDTPSDWQWYTRLGALQRRFLPPERVGGLLKRHVVEVAGNPRDYGAPEPDPDIFVAGNALCQDYLAQVAAGQITCRPAIDSVHGQSVTFVDGSIDQVDVLLMATGYELDVPYLADSVWSVTGADLRLHLRTTHPALPGFAAVGQFLAQGPYFPLLELQAMLAVATWTDALPVTTHQGEISHDQPAVEPHHVLAGLLAEALGVEPDPREHADLAEPLLLGPLLPPRYHLSRQPEAAHLFTQQLATSPKARTFADDLETFPDLGLTGLVQG
jgi:dimethylaniline monooxygenase (N-oxide forming)